MHGLSNFLYWKFNIDYLNQRMCINLFTGCNLRFHHVIYQQSVDISLTLSRLFSVFNLVQSKKRRVICITLTL